MKRLGLLMVAGVAMLTLFGCASGMKAVENAELKTDVKMSESIFLEPSILMTAMEPGSGVYVRVTNTSEVQDFDFASEIKKRLTSLGYNILPTPKGANYQLSANILYLGPHKPGTDLQSLVMGGAGGATLGALIAASNNRSGSAVLGAGLAGGLIGSAGEYAVDKMWTVKEYTGVVDLQIKEGCLSPDATKVLQNRIAVSAKQTNLDLKEAGPILADIVGTQITGMFKL